MNEIEIRARVTIENLLFKCAGGTSGQSVLLVHEEIGDGFYDADLHQVIANKAKELGFFAHFYPIAFDPDIKAMPEDLVRASSLADHTIFVARLGDQIRFLADIPDATWIIIYAIDVDMLVSDFGMADYAGFSALKSEINKFMIAADHIHVTCPAGSNFSGHAKDLEAENNDVKIKRFPMSIFAPLPTMYFEGRIAQNGFLVGTGSRYYTPYACGLQKTLFIEFSGHKLIGFYGDKADVTLAKNHYQFVADKYGIDPFFIHSWHAGIHPACAFNAPASASFERWSGASFGNPRLLHFHTCGKYPPGEISLNIVDPTISIDGDKVWEAGVLYPERLPFGTELLAEFPSLKRTFDHPAKNIGLGEAGLLSFI